MNTCSTKEIIEVFGGFTTERGGRVHDSVTDGDRFYVRCVFAKTEEARPNDLMRGGLAMRGDAASVEVRPYLFREICANGAILAQSSAGSVLARTDCTPEALGDAFTVAAADEIFRSAMIEVRSSTAGSFEMGMAVVSLMGRMRSRLDHRFLLDAFDRYRGAGDPSAFGLMNAVTSLARDTSDPESRWQLEEAGGGVLALLLCDDRTRLGAGALEFPTTSRELISR